MKQIYKLLLLAAIAATALPATAYDFMVDGICYDINADGNSVTVTYEREPSSNDYISYSNASGTLTIPSTVTYDGKFYSVTSIGEYAFCGCRGFTGSLTIPNSVTTIGDYTFSGCSGFDESLTIPNSMAYIGSSAFEGCRGFTGLLTIPNSVTLIREFAFDGCSGFTGLTIGNSITEINYRTFFGCSGFTGSLNIPNSVTTIDDWAFYGCSGFTGSLTIGNSVTSIGYAAFDGCSGFTGSLTIPNSVTSIGSCAFSNCTGLETLTVESGNPKYDSRENCNAVIETATNTLVCGIKTFSIPNSVTSIGNSAFSGCSGFTGSLTIPNSVTSIGRAAFSDCSGFTGSLNIPNSVTTIDDYAFSGCSGFTGSLTIPNSVTTIGDYAFQNCNGFTGSLTIPNSVTALGRNPFDNYYNWIYYPIAFSSLILNGDGEFWLNSGSMPSINTVYIQSGITGIKGLRLSPYCVYSYATTPPKCDENAFTQYTADLHVPKRTLAAYASAPYWSIFTNITGDAVEPEVLEWEQDSVSLKLGDQLTLEPPFLTPDNTGLDVNIVSLKPEVVSLSRNYDYNAGEYVYTILGLKAGEADIIASCLWIESRLHVTVTEDVITITLDKHEVEMEAGAVATLTPSSSPVPVEFAVQSSDPSVVIARMVNGKVQLISAKPGVAVITVSDVEGKATPDSCRVTVVRPVGDATGDGYLDIDDVNAMINVMLDMVPRPEGEELNYYDFDGNSKVDIDDLNQLINILLAQ